MSLELIGTLTFLLFISSDMETNSFTWLKMGTLHKMHIQSKIKINSLLSYRGVCQGCLFCVLLYIIGAEVLASFINSYKRIKGIQIADHEIKIVNFVDYTTIFLRDIACHK